MTFLLSGHSSKIKKKLDYSQDDMSARWTFPSIFREFRAGTGNESEAAIFHGHVTDVNSGQFSGTDCKYDTTINCFVLNSSRVIASLNIRGRSRVLGL